MATATKLFEMVTNDDMEGLEILSNSGKTIDWNMKLRGCSLIYRAIEVRAQRTFDFLLNLPNLKILQSDDCGLSKAIEYYVKAPNVRNMYYVDRLMEKNAKVSSFVVTRAQHDNALFEYMFEKMDKSYESIRSILTNLISSNNMNLVQFIYNYLDNNQQDYY